MYSATEGRIGNKKVILAGTNNYLGLTFNHDAIAEGQAALAAQGTGTTGSRMANGRYAPHLALEKEIAEINLRIKDLTRAANSVITPIFYNTKKYLIELGLDGDSISEKYLFTSNLKELSGAILHKTVFAFRLACLLEVEKHLNIKKGDVP